MKVVYPGALSLACVTLSHAATSYKAVQPLLPPNANVSAADIKLITDSLANSALAQ
jgi:hypothetical protein